MDKKAAKELLKDYEERLRKCVLQGVAEARKAIRETLHVYSTTTKAALFRDHIVAKMESTFIEDPSVRFVERQGLRLLVIGENENAVQLRVKKFDKNFISRNVPTTQNELFRTQGYVPMPGVLHQLPNLEIGYVLDNKTRTSIETVAVVSPSRYGINWDWPLESKSKTVSMDLSKKSNLETTHTAEDRVKEKVLKERGIANNERKNKKRGNS